MTTSERYKKEIKTLVSSGCRVMFTRTREPYRAMDAIKELAFGENMPFNQWDFVNGWRMFQPSMSQGQGPDTKAIKDPFTAAKAIMAVDMDWNFDQAMGSGYYVMHAIQNAISNMPPFVELLRQYVRFLPVHVHPVNLIIVCHESAALPDELIHDIPTVDFDLPSIDEMKEVLDYIIESSADEEITAKDVFGKGEVEIISSSAGGLTQMEAELAFSRAIVENRKGNEGVESISFDEFNKTVLDAKTEIIKQSEVLELMESVDMSEVGGLDVLKEWIENAKCAFDEEAREYGVDVPAGIAAIGPPGTGKTLVGKAIATTLGQPLVKFDVSKCFGSLVGQSEARVRSALKQLEAMGRVTVLFDEIDKSLGGSHQSSGDSGVSRRVLGAILTFMQETKAPIFPIYTANRTESLPPELLRKGRLDEVFAVLPPNRKEREAVLKIHLRKRKQNPDKIKDLHIAVDCSRGYVSAELEAGVKEAVLLSYKRKVPVTGQLIADALSQMNPLSEAFPDDFQNMLEWAQHNARLASTPCEDEQEEHAAYRKSSAPVVNSSPRVRTRRKVSR